MRFVTVKLPFAARVKSKAGAVFGGRDPGREKVIAFGRRPPVTPAAHMKRRTFLTAAAATATLPVSRLSSAELVAATPGGLIDTNVDLSAWATRRTGLETPAALVAKLRRHGVEHAWTGNFEGVLHSDIAGANFRLAEMCTREGGGILQPFGTINPTLPDWEDDVRRCQEQHRMAGVRLHPNYHGYTLDDARFSRLLDLSVQRRLLVQIVLSIEDDRSQNPLLTSAPVQAAPLVEIMQKIPAARVMLLNSTSRVLAASNPLLRRLVAAGVSFEIATLEGVAGIQALLGHVPGLRLAFGSHTPYFYFEAALLKLQESELTPAQLTAIRYGNARAALTLA